MAMDIAAWLRGLGLDQYLPAFRANDIDREVLPRLTAEDLRELGLASIGHRRGGAGRRSRGRRKNK
jgi:hypothetical protein